MYSQDFLCEKYYLDEDGDLFHRSNGRIATWNNGRYLGVSIYKTKYYAHRVIWCMVHGYWPKDDIDHKDGDPRNNRPDNLREATRSQNLANSERNRMRGVRWNGAGYCARIHVEGQEIWLGSYRTVEEAKAAYQAGADRHFGEYAFHNRED